MAPVAVNHETHPLSLLQGAHEPILLPPDEDLQLEEPPQAVDDLLGAEVVQAGDEAVGGEDHQALGVHGGQVHGGELKGCVGRGGGMEGAHQFPIAEGRLEAMMAIGYKESLLPHEAAYP